MVSMRKLLRASHLSTCWARTSGLETMHARKAATTMGSGPDGRSMVGLFMISAFRGWWDRRTLTTLITGGTIQFAGLLRRSGLPASPTWEEKWS